MKKYLLPLILAFSFFTLGYSAASQVEFVATVEDMIAEDSETGILKMALTPSFSLDVRVTPFTEIRDGESQLNFSDLAAGMTLRIEGIFGDDGIKALEIEVTDDAAEIEIKGEISEIDAGAQEIVVSGFRIHVTSATELKDSDGTPLLFTDLNLFDFVKVEAFVSGDRLEAEEIKVRNPEEKFARISFEGIVTDIQDSTIFVLIDGMSAPATAEITSDTEIKGTLAVGVLVRVIGHFNPDLSVTADKILVKRLLQLAPDKLRMHFDQTRRVEVILRNPLEEDIELTIASLDPSVAVPSVSSLLIPAGQPTSFFEVTSAFQEGETEIEVKTPDLLGGLVVTLKVEVRSSQKIDDDDDDADEGDEDELELKWAPPQLNLRAGEQRTVRLMLNGPAPDGLMAALSVKKGDPSLLIGLPSDVIFAPGGRFAEVTFQAGPTAGEIEVRATLPNGEEEEIEIRIRPDQAQQPKLEWSPDEVEAGLNETVSVQLQLSRPGPGVQVTISPVGNAADLIDFPPQVSFAAGSTSITVQIVTKGQPGEAELVASLPFTSGGDSAKLEVEIEEEEEE